MLPQLLDLHSVNVTLVLISVAKNIDNIPILYILQSRM